MDLYLSEPLRKELVQLSTPYQSGIQSSKLRRIISCSVHGGKLPSQPCREPLSSSVLCTTETNAGTRSRHCGFRYQKGLATCLIVIIQSDWRIRSVWKPLAQSELTSCSSAIENPVTGKGEPRPRQGQQTIQACRRLHVPTRFCSIMSSDVTSYLP